MFSPFWIALKRNKRRSKIIESLKQLGFPLAKADPPEWYLRDWEKLHQVGISYLDKVKREIATDFILENAEKFYPYWLKIKDCEWVKIYKVGSRWFIKCKHMNGKIKSLHNLKNPEEKLAIYKVLLGFKNSIAGDLLEKLAIFLNQNN